MNTKLVVFFLVLSVAALGQDCAQRFADYLKLYPEKQYNDTLLYQSKQNAYCQNVQKIDEHNSNPLNSNYTLKENQFTDQLDSERARTYIFI
jgi:hypothetical protein